MPAFARVQHTDHIHLQALQKGTSIRIFHLSGGAVSYSVLGSIPNTAESGGQPLLDSANGALTLDIIGDSGILGTC